VCEREIERERERIYFINLKVNVIFIIKTNVERFIGINNATQLELIYKIN
jgi:hypothetical protein